MSKRHVYLILSSSFADAEELAPAA